MTGHVRTRVVVVGGGPVGLLVAAELGAFGVDTVVLEAAAEVSMRPRATTLHARALQCLVRRGYLPELRPRDTGGEGSTAPFHFGGVEGLPLSVPAGEPGPLLKRAQADLERMLEERAAAAGARILRRHRVTEVTQDADGVRAVAEGPEGALTVTGEFLVGADGARSTVRELAGIGSQEWPATVSAMAGLVDLAQDKALEAGWHRTARGWLVVKHEPGGGTHLRTLNCSRTHARRDEPLTLQELRDEVSWLAGRHVEMERGRWLTRFSDFSRLADRYRAGRVLLVGDAAHLHFPIGGQGLSTGLQDAIDLGWKLALTVRGRAGAGLLDSYDLERRPAARRVIDNTQAQLALMRPGAEVDALRSVFAEMLASQGPGSRVGDLVSAQDTVLPQRFGPSPWEGRFLPNVALRTPQGETDLIGLLREGRPLLMLFGGPDALRIEEQAGSWADVVRVVRAEPVASVPCEAVLVRPDGYVGWAPGGADLEAALEGCFGRRARGGAGDVGQPRAAGS
ncbi:2-polyprenyl-6-methoxyphenol hydroxylase-like FAD-dependent oxidoreductase [Streptomyces sp. SAI-170]|uniref:FAD-dependent monooxygenase n=1 Tax=Streptomyces sp. SAI-170 TaxID=3377729 RepID=UPI003C79730A